MMTSIYKPIIILLKKKRDLFALGLILCVTILITTNHNIKKQKILEKQKNFVNNIFFQKTLNTLFSNLDQKFQKIKHKVLDGETFDQILKTYQIDDSEIIDIKKKLKKRYDLNKLKSNQNFEFVIDKSKNKKIKFIFPLSKTEKIYLVKSSENDEFFEEIVITNWLKK